MILEAHYHPEVYRLFENLNTRTDDLLFQLASSYEEVEYIKVNEYVTLKDEDYRDPVHLSFEGGEKLFKGFVEVLNNRKKDYNSGNLFINSRHSGINIG